ncbi:Lipid-A-disaccharide synthase [Rickettsia prowazekii str. GvF12]|nr:Lipid-A-disaccharide synthase [Rickettsia prowazekii str. GvF12]
MYSNNNTEYKNSKSFRKFNKTKINTKKKSGNHSENVIEH